MNAKQEILHRLRRALAPQDASVADIPRHYRHEGDDAPGSAAVLDSFQASLEDYTATVVRATKEDIPTAIARFLQDVDSVVVPAGLDPAWKSAAGQGRQLHEDSRDKPIEKTDLDHIDAVVTHSRCAVATTGSIVLDAEDDQGRRAISLVPDTHVVVVDADQVYPLVPQAVSVLAEHPDRPITWISGPSATSDIEMTRVDGVHGPRTLRVIIVEN